MKYPFEASREELAADLDGYVSAVFTSLESEFLWLPKGDGFVDYPAFQRAYETLRQATNGFTSLDPRRVVAAVTQTPLVFAVLRSILGFTPPELAYLTTQRTGVQVSQTFARNVDRRARLSPFAPLKSVASALEAMVVTACQLISTPVPEVDADRLHRLDKADTKHGTISVRHLAEMGAPYSMLLYERFLGRPFAGHRDSVSELVGGGLESAIEDVLNRHGVGYRKTKRAERIPGFDQAPDFVIPDEFHPLAVIEAKVAEDDGTARDKVTRVQHLASLSAEGQPAGGRRFAVIACIAGRGFGVRREDMKKLLLATGGKVFTLGTLDRLVECSALRDFAAWQV